MAQADTTRSARRNGHEAGAPVDEPQSVKSGSPSLVNRAWRELAGVVQRRLPRADLDERDPDYIREQLPRFWLLSSIWFRGEVRGLGNIAHELVDQKEMADMADPFYNQFARGGEGHLEVGKNVYYTKNQLCHMVLALKPFGCMPSSQSDGVQSAVANHFKEMIFLPIETSGEGEVNAHSRVQMALGEAKVKAKTEFEQCLKSTGKSMEEIREYIAENPELRRPFYHVPHREGVTGTAAQFVLHVSDRMDKSTRLWKRARVPGIAVPNAA